MIISSPGANDPRHKRRPSLFCDSIWIQSKLDGLDSNLARLAELGAIVNCSRRFRLAFLQALGTGGGAARTTSRSKQLTCAARLMDRACVMDARKLAHSSGLTWPGANSAINHTATCARAKLALYRLDPMRPSRVKLLLLAVMDRLKLTSGSFVSKRLLVSSDTCRSGSSRLAAT